MDRYFSVINDPSFTLKEWRDIIQRLIDEHGEDTILYSDAGYNNVQFFLTTKDEI